MRYKKGDYVRYASTGVCVVEDIRTIKDRKRHTEGEFYVLKPVSANASTVYVPTDNENLTSKMRYVMSKNDIDEVISEVKCSDTKWIDDRKLRAVSFSDTVRHGNNKDLLGLIACIYMKKYELETIGKRLSSADEAALIGAQRLVEDEFSFVLGVSCGEVAAYIKSKL